MDPSWPNLPVRIHKRGIRPAVFGENVAALGVVIAVETWRLEPLEKDFPSKR